ncbi:MAG: ABC transporter substrate-binding protein [Candidatus Woesebacteria bacterium]|jgi:peptide/nickel transport system substrate-binding protein
MDQDKMEQLKKVTDAETHKKIKRKLLHLEGLTIRHAHHFIIRRWQNLKEVRRSAAGWVILVLLLSAAVIWQSSETTNYYSQEIPSEGATYSEGVVGAVDNLNPIFASTQAERSVARLLFASLLKYDEKGDLIGELAHHWYSDDAGKVYEVILRDDAYWSDGEPITSADVVYTFSAIKNADSKSPLYSSWRNISVEAIDEQKVRFTLPTAYAPFLSSLTVGILPQHKLENLRFSELRNNAFNNNPTVTSGVFSFQDVRSINKERTHFLVSMAANDDYVLGKPKLNRFHLHAYADKEHLASAFTTQEVAAVSDVDTSQVADLSEFHDPTITMSPLYNATYAFFNMDSPFLTDGNVRHALELATNRSSIISALDNRVELVAGPLLPGQIGYSSDLVQPDVNHAVAAELLDKAGWVLDSSGHRVKDGQQLKINLVTVNSDVYSRVAQEIVDQWSKLGISFESQLVRADDIQQNVIVPRAYDVLIYEVAIGKDPDVYAYWHSSQANERGFNLSNYKSTKADDALISARDKSDVALREAKYRSFMQQWLADAPAVGLYRSNLIYVQTKKITSFEPHALAEQIDRYANIRYWSANKEKARPTL